MLRKLEKVVLAFALLQVAPLAAAFANTRTFVSNTGTDTGQCGPDAPCQTIGYAYGKTEIYGEIVLMNSGNYYGGPITKSITIRSDGSPVSITGAFTVNVGKTDRVTFDGIDLNGRYPSGAYGTGLMIAQGGDVLITNCKFRNYVVSGLQIAPSGTSVRVTIINSVFFNDAIGITMSSSDSVTVGHLKLINSQVVSNATAGVQVIGTGNDVSLSGNQILGSAKALDLQSGGVATSYGNNVITNGDKPSVAPLS